MELNELTRKYKNNIFNIALIIFALIVANNIYKKQAKVIESLKAKVDLELKKNDVLNGIGQLEKKINSYKSLLTRKESNVVMNVITNIARDSEVKIISIRPASENRQADYIKFTFALILNTPNYHALGKFISKLESYQDVYSVETVTVASQDETKRALTVNLNVSSIVFN